MNLDQALSFLPIYQQRVWGGRVLEIDFGRELPHDGLPYGESWELVDRPEALSLVDGAKGMSLADLWQDYREEVFGVDAPDSDRFPILCKILDCSERLSLQVHPPADVAAELGGEAKTEMWYIASAEPGAELYVGVREGVTREALKKALLAGDAEKLVHKVKVKAGEFLFIPSGRLHAIGGGLVIYEIQQNSDTTYRVFDWNRVGLDGKPRQLHVEESLKCIDFSDVEPTADEVAADGETLVECEYFRVSRWEVDDLDGRSTEGFAVVTVVDGSVVCGQNVFETGSFFVIPEEADEESVQLYAEDADGATILVTRWPE